MEATDSVHYLLKAFEESLKTFSYDVALEQTSLLKDLFPIKSSRGRDCLISRRFRMTIFFLFVIALVQTSNQSELVLIRI